MLRQVGVSPKVLAPLQVALGAFVSSWIVTGHVVRDVASTLAVATIGTVFAYYAPPGNIEVVTDSESEGAPA